MMKSPAGYRRQTMVRVVWVGDRVAIVLFRLIGEERPK